MAPTLRIQHANGQSETLQVAPGRKIVLRPGDRVHLEGGEVAQVQVQGGDLSLRLADGRQVLLEDYLAALQSPQGLKLELPEPSSMHLRILHKGQVARELHLRPGEKLQLKADERVVLLDPILPGRMQMDEDQVVFTNARGERFTLQDPPHQGLSLGERLQFPELFALPTLALQPEGRGHVLPLQLGQALFDFPPPVAGQEGSLDALGRRQAVVGEVPLVGTDAPEGLGARVAWVACGPAGPRRGPTQRPRRGHAAPPW